MQVDYECEETDLLVLQFEACAYEKSGILGVNCGETSNNVYLSTIPHAYYIPITDISSIGEIRLELISDYQKTDISYLYLVNYGSDYDINKIKTGVYDLSQYTRTIISPDNPLIERSTAAITDGAYLYSIYHGEMSIYEVKESGISLVGSLEGLGDTRDLDFTKNKDSIVVASRRNGAYIVDIKDKSRPYIISHYDALEYCSGLDIADDCLFLASRWFGVEIIDISDLNNPKFLTRIQNENEYQNCCYYNGFLYVGVYNGKRVDIWDVNDLNNVDLVKCIELDGCGHGLYVDDNVLYAATGLRSRNKCSKLEDFGMGTGNGLEIYNVSDPKNPQWLSTTKMDGRLSINTNDIWDVAVSDGLAYVSNMFNGVYIIDVNNPTAPILRETINIVADKNDPEYNKSDTAKYVFSYDTDQEARGSIYHTVFNNGSLYVISQNMGVFKIDKENVNYNMPDKRGVDTKDFLKTDGSLPKLENYNFELFSSDSQIWAVAPYKGLLAVALGEKGIAILDEDLNIISEYDTEYAVRDIKSVGNYILTAECEGGLGVYTVDGENNINKISSYTNDKFDTCFGQIQLTHDNKFVLAETSASTYAIIDISDVNNMTEVTADEEKKPGMMYYRSICNGLVKGKYIGISGTLNYLWLYSDDNGNMKCLKADENKVYGNSGRSDGSVAYGNYCLSTYNKGYVYFDPETDKYSSKVRIQNVDFNGKLSMWGNILVISTENTGHIMFVDISDIDDPKVNADFIIDGNPDLACCIDDNLYLPCRNYGLLKISKNY